MMFGTPSAMNSKVYPTFWNYEKGNYTFSEAEETLDMYRKIYNNGLINDDFNTKESIDILNDFADGKVAITFSHSYNNEFPAEDTASMDMSVQDMPVFKNSESNKRYYHPSTRIMVVRNYDKEVDALTNVKEKYIEAHKKAVKKVYEWLASEDVKNSLINSEINLVSGNKGSDSSFENSKLNNTAEFGYGTLDPSTFIEIDKNIIRDKFTQLIKGNDDMNSELIKLEDTISTKIENNEETIKINLYMYKEQE